MEFVRDAAMVALSMLTLHVEMMQEASAATLETNAAKSYTIQRLSMNVNHVTQRARPSKSIQRFAQQSKTSTNGLVIRTLTQSWLHQASLRWRMVALVSSFSENVHHSTTAAPVLLSVTAQDRSDSLSTPRT